jgi:putative toxin-antitoxin system antitoxin component (TIGR02293 family)
MVAAQVLPVETPVDPIEEILKEGGHGANVLARVEERFEPSIIDRLLQLGFERSELDSIVIPSRTLQHRRSRKERLTVEESDRIVRLLRILRLTEEVYASRERALQWLRTPKARLDPRLAGQLFGEGGPVPITLLKTETGARMVEQLLLQIAEGVFV